MPSASTALYIRQFDAEGNWAWNLKEAMKINNQIGKDLQFMKLAWMSRCVLFLALLANSAGAQSVGLFSVDDQPAALDQDKLSKNLLHEDTFSDGPLAGDALAGGVHSLEGRFLERKMSEGEADELRDRDIDTSSIVMRSRTVGIDFGQLTAARDAVSQQNSTNLKLNLFADAEFEAVFERTTPTESGYSLSGRLKDMPLSTVTLVVNSNVVAGWIQTLDAVYAVRTAIDGYVIRQMDMSNFPGCGLDEFLTRPAFRKSSAQSKAASERKADSPRDDGRVIDVLVVYPRFVRKIQGGHPFMRTLIDLDFALANEAYRISGVTQLQINLVATIEVDYSGPEGTFGAERYDLLDALKKLSAPNDGFMDEIHGLRNAYAADLVSIHFGDPFNYYGRDVPIRLAGVADWMDDTGISPDTGGDPAFSASVTGWVFAHELGHNMGLLHERAISHLDRQGKLFPYVHGHVVKNKLGGFPLGWSTIMAYGDFGDRSIARFSNPNQNYPDESGEPLGVPGSVETGTEDGPADAVRALSQTRHIVANHKASANRCAYTLSENSSTPPPDGGGEFRFRVETSSPTCKWSARTLDEFLHITSDANGIGDGEVTYQLSINKGWDREAAIMIAGEMHTVYQQGTRPLTPVCQRSPEARDTIVATVNKPCAEIASRDLLSITRLQLGALSSGDLEGLSNLSWLVVRSSTPLSLQSNAFDGLPLEILNLNGSKLTTLDPAALNGLSDLGILALSGSQLTELPLGIFDQLPNLVVLDLSENQLKELPSGVFEGLPNLRSLNLRGNQLTELMPDVLSGLSNLKELFINRNQLTSLPSGVFDGMHSLETLDAGENRLISVQRGALYNLTNLKRLRLSGNHLSGFHSDAFLSLGQLTYLGLSNNPLRKLESGMFNGLGSLQELYLQGTLLQTLPAQLLNNARYLETLDLRNSRLTTIPSSAFSPLSNLGTLLLGGNFLTEVDQNWFAALTGSGSFHTLDLSDNALSALDAGIFQELELGRLWLNGNKIRSLQPGTFRGLSVYDLRLGDNQLKTLELGTFDGLSELERLYLQNNQMRVLQPNVFNGLSQVSRLDLSGNPLHTVKQDAFDGLPNLRFLWFSNIPLQNLQAGAFGKFSKLQRLYLDNTRLTALAPNTFEGMSDLVRLYLRNNELRSLVPGTFNGLPKLEGLYLEKNQLETLASDVFDELPELVILDLNENRLQALEPGALRNLGKLEILLMASNRLSVLPADLFKGKSFLRKIDLQNNPGAPFTLRPELVPLPAVDSASGDSANIALRVTEGAPFPMSVGLSVSGGTLQVNEARINAGSVRGVAIPVPRGNGPIIVRLDEKAPLIPGPSPCSLELFFRGSVLYCYRGIQTAAGGAPLILHGFLDQSLTLGNIVKFDLSSAFQGFIGTYMAQSNDPAVAVSIQGNILTISSNSEGDATVTVTATGRNGSRVTRKFQVMAGQGQDNYRSFLRGWRLPLLRGDLKGRRAISDS